MPRRPERRFSQLSSGICTGGSKAEHEFLRVIHQSACKRFGTVLSPDYDGAHRDHFHLDLVAGEFGSSFCR